MSTLTVLFRLYRVGRSSVLVPRSRTSPELRVITQFIESSPRTNLFPSTSVFSNPESNRLFSTTSLLTASKDDYYERLGVSPNASAEEIKAAFYRLSKQFHPDINQSEEAVDNFMKVRSAYDVLGNQLKRREYDKSLVIRKGDQIVEDMFPPGWKERQKKEREDRKADEEMEFTADDIKKKKQRYQEAADEYKAYQRQRDARPENVDPKVHEVKQMWLDFTSWAYGHYRRHVKFYRLLFVVLLIKLYQDLWYRLPRDTRPVDELNRDAGPDYSDWIWSDFARRWKWRQNLDRLPKMVEEEQQAEKDRMLERFKRINSGTEDRKNV